MMRGKPIRRWRAGHDGYNARNDLDPKRQRHLPCGDGENDRPLGRETRQRIYVLGNRRFIIHRVSPLGTTALGVSGCRPRLSA